MEDSRIENARSLLLEALEADDEKKMRWKIFDAEQIIAEVLGEF